MIQTLTLVSHLFHGIYLLKKMIYIAELVLGNSTIAKNMNYSLLLWA